MPSGIIFTIIHNWSSAGMFTVTVYAEDEYAARSNTVSFTMSINVQSVGNIGYLIDENSDDSYDIFYDIITGKETPVEKEDTSRYLIDSNGDNIWDYIYDVDTDTLDKYEQQSGIDLTLLIAILASIGIIILILIFLLKRREKEENSKNSRIL